MAAIGIMVVTVFLFTMIDTSAKWLILAGVPAIQVVWSRYTGAFAVTLLSTIVRGRWGDFRSNRPWLQLARALSLMFGTIFNFLALIYLPITLTIAIFFAMPLVTTVLSVPILGEKVGMRRLMVIALGFVGVLIMIGPWGADFHWAVGLSLCSLVFASLYFVLTRALAGVDSNATCQLWTNGIATLCLVPVALMGLSLPETGWGLLVFAGIGVFGATSHILATLAYRFAPAQTVAPVTYVQAIYAAAVGYLVFDTPPTLATAVGSAIVIASGIYIWHRERMRVRDGVAI